MPGYRPPMSGYRDVAARTIASLFPPGGSQQHDEMAGTLRPPRPGGFGRIPG